MHTLGAVILSFIAVMIFQFILGIVNTFFFQAILSSTDIIWLPILMMAGFTGSAFYGAIYLGLKIAKEANSKATVYIIVGLYFFLIFWNFGQIETHGEAGIFPFIISNILNGIGSVIGSAIAKYHIESEREESLIVKYTQ